MEIEHGVSHFGGSGSGPGQAFVRSIFVSVSRASRFILSCRLSPRGAGTKGWASAPRSPVSAAPATRHPSPAGLCRQLIGRGRGEGCPSLRRAGEARAGGGPGEECGTTLPRAAGGAGSDALLLSAVRPGPPAAQAPRWRRGVPGQRPGRRRKLERRRSRSASFLLSIDPAPPGADRKYGRDLPTGW